ncbi:MAG: class I SAM-dependent methyltransferase [Chromatiaceae bacterium]|nr:class I SAM-dependent methyltransferase [Chromatiaceae bacterium]MCP5315070.1 class I SAM-dependent methyltransferase [Chromatiaceae bacterium]
MQRIPEPEELMDDAEQAYAYARADFSEANSLFVALLEEAAGGTLDGRLLDLGCGPADIPLDLLHRHPRLAVDALDGAPAMLALAREHLATAGERFLHRMQLLCEHLPCEALRSGHYQFVASNSLLHHLADPAVMWQTVARCAAPGAQVLVMDLARPASEIAVDALVETYAMDAPEVLRRDFRNSLFAAYTPDEVEGQLMAAGLGGLQVDRVSDRHLAISGVLD